MAHNDSSSMSKYSPNARSCTFAGTEVSDAANPSFLFMA